MATSGAVAVTVWAAQAVPVAETITIDGVAYLVVEAMTPEQAEAKGYANVARLMREQGRLRQMFLRRPRGNRMYFTSEYSTRQGVRYTPAISMGAWS
jgi:hypothetical protein